MARPTSRSRGRPSSGSSIATQIEPRHRSCQLLWLSSQWLACQSLSAAAHRVVGLGEASRVGGGLEDRDVGAGLHDQLLERQIRSRCPRTRRRRGTCRPASRTRGRSRARRSRSGRRSCASGSTCCATAPGCTAPARRSWASDGRRSRRTARRFARQRAIRSVVVTVIVVSLARNLCYYCALTPAPTSMP